MDMFTANFRVGPADDYYYPSTRFALVGNDVLTLVRAALDRARLPSKVKKELGQLVINDYERTHTINAAAPYRVAWGNFVAELTLGGAEVVNA